MYKLSWMAIPLLALSTTIYLGCDNGTGGDQADSGGGDQAQTDHGHGDDHDHGDDHGDGEHEHHAHGPHGGEIISFTPSDFRGEVVTSKSAEDQLTLHIMNLDDDDAHLVPAATITARVTQGREPQTFELAAVAPVGAADAAEGDPAMASEFSVEANELIIAYNAFGFELEMEVDGKTYTASVPKNPH